MDFLNFFPDTKPAKTGKKKAKAKFEPPPTGDAPAKMKQLHSDVYNT